jgi:hypothetical protein
MLDKLPLDSKIFIFQADRFLTSADIDLIKSKMNQFLPTWATHGTDLTADYCIEHNLFLIVGNDEAKAATSGCSKDSLTRVVKGVGEELGIDFFNRLNISYQTPEEKIKLVNMSEFKSLLKKDEVSQTSLVFNNLIESKSDLESKWIVPVKNSWHKNLISIL